MDVEFFRAGLDLKIISQRIQTSLEEIKEKSPNRMEYIDPMHKSIEQLNNVIRFLNQIEIELNTSRQRNIDLENLLLIEKAKVKELQDNISNDNLEL